VIPQTLTFYDAAWPPDPPPQTDGACIYVGGDTPHVWTLPEIVRQPARFRLPIWVRSDPLQAKAITDAAACLRQLALIGAPRGCLVALDVETAIDPSYVQGFGTLLIAGGHPIMAYGSLPGLFHNDIADGWYWGADWTDRPHLCAGTVMTQYATFRTYDADLAETALPFWDGLSRINPTVDAWQEILMQQLPVVQLGTANDSAARSVQGLCCARGFTVAVDGAFGPRTALAVRGIQAKAGITADGIVGPATWPVLLAVQ